MEQQNTTIIYLNERPLILCARQKDIPGDYKDAPVCPTPDAGAISHTLKALEAGEIPAAVFVQADTQRLLAAIKGHFEEFVAAGGLVTNPEGDILLIFRKGKWDLPKGKQDDGESLEECALREVQEETGLRNITLGEKITETYHYYPLKEQKVLKHTYWYNMLFHGTELTVPQIEEDIMDIQWIRPEHLGKYLKFSYKNIVDVFERAGYNN
ncbi:NUDIX hydrolase [Chitinophaga japonensis]|uniref:NUDIX domain-containing protein n=1 Tax=Chitinophaga japonensis TaxID=104662 RepID=A0A562ST58_CHIJA|nr:NUDIX domain-containing protein [Chitinophaga japonensis]TWI84323.1 NUDIX domain-containing protein [Chitinophaga japonensis]